MKKNKIKYDEVTNEQSFGAYGFIDIVNGTTTLADDRFAVLQAEADTTFSFENEAENGTLSASNYVLEKGTSRYGYFKNIVVTSGKLVGYYAK